MEMQRECERRRGRHGQTARRETKEAREEEGRRCEEIEGEGV